MRGDIDHITFTSDGTRLIIEYSNGGADIFDIRSAKEQIADIEHRWAERVPAGEYLDTLMAGPTPTDELMPIIETDDTLTPLRRLAAAEVLEERLADIEYQADRAFEAITKDQTDQTKVLAAATAADLPPRVKEQVLAKAQAWEYTPPKVTKLDRLSKNDYLLRQIMNDAMMTEETYDELVGVLKTQIDLFGKDNIVVSEKLFRLGWYSAMVRRESTGFERMREAIDIRLSVLENPDLTTLKWMTDLAMLHFQLAKPLPESDPARGEHLAAANEALTQCQAIMADPNALNDAGNPWAEDRVAQSLLAEAEALIGGGDE